MGKPGKRRIRVLGLATTLVMALLLSTSVFAGTSDQGYWIEDRPPFSHTIGIQADISTLSSMNLIPGSPGRNEHVFVTLMPAGTSCVEALSYAYKSATAGPTTPTSHYFRVFNHCVPDGTAPGASVLYPMDATFLGKYERVVTYPSVRAGQPNFQDKTMRLAITRSSAPPTNCWRAYLWNYNTGAWDGFQQFCGTSYEQDAPAGWTMLETYGFDTASSNNICADFGAYHVAQARSIKYYRDDLPPPQTTMVNSTDTPYGIHVNNGCWADGSWDWVGGGADWIACDGVSYAKCEG